jgi:nitrile hydratase
MNGVHDMGGMTDFGPVQREAEEPLFHVGWERRVMGMVRSVVDNHYNWDEFRFAIERIDPVIYLSSSYYERWLTALERYLIEKGIVDPEELRLRTAGAAPKPGLTPDTPRAAHDALSEVDDTGPVAAPSPSESPRFQPGDAVRARNVNPAGHTRLPRYVRGKRGTIDRFLGVFTFPDTNALQLGDYPQPVYAVTFAATELWGEQASGRDTICVDLWEAYLKPAEAT